MAPRHGDIERSLLLALGFVLTLVLLDRCEYVHASPMSARDALARVCAVEETLDASPGCAAIGHVLARRSVTGEVTASIACAYSAHFRDDCSPRHERRPWAHAFDAKCEEPPGWPQNARWRPERCERLYAQVDRIMAGRERDTCHGVPNHFGSVADAHRAVARGWGTVWCPGTRSIFMVER